MDQRLEREKIDAEASDGSSLAQMHLDMTDERTFARKLLRSSSRNTKWWFMVNIIFLHETLRPPFTEIWSENKHGHGREWTWTGTEELLFKIRNCLLSTRLSCGFLGPRRIWNFNVALKMSTNVFPHRKGVCSKIVHRSWNNTFDCDLKTSHWTCF